MSEYSAIGHPKRRHCPLIILHYSHYSSFLVSCIVCCFAFSSSVRNLLSGMFKGSTYHCIAIHKPAARMVRKKTWMFFVKNINGINSASNAANDMFIALTSIGVGPGVIIESHNDAAIEAMIAKVVKFNTTRRSPPQKLLGIPAQSQKIGSHKPPSARRRSPRTFTVF